MMTRWSVYTGIALGVASTMLVAELWAGPDDIETGAGAAPAHEAPGNIVFPERGYMEEIRPAVFPHWFHRVRFRCSVCHPEIFPMRSGELSISMDAIRRGEFCGTCHGTDTAWGPTFDTCTVCHRG